MQTPSGGNHMTGTVRKRRLARGKTKVNTLRASFSSTGGAVSLRCRPIKTFGDIFQS